MTVRWTTLNGSLDARHAFARVPVQTDSKAFSLLLTFRAWAQF